MIFTNINNIKEIESSNPLFKMLFDRLKMVSISDFNSLDRIDIIPDKVFYIKSIIEGGNMPLVLEGHQKYIDIHFLLKGQEIIGWKSLENATQLYKQYSPSNDCVFYEDKPTEYFHLNSGDVFIAYPHDLHCPGISNKRIIKIIGKILI